MTITFDPRAAAKNEVRAMRRLVAAPKRSFLAWLLGR